MAGLLSGLKSAAIAQIPGLIETAKPQIKEALVKQVSKLPPGKVTMLSNNLGELKAAVDTAAAQQVSAMQTQAPAPVTAGKRKKTSKKTRRNKKK